MITPTVLAGLQKIASLSYITPVTIKRPTVGVPGSAATDYGNVITTYTTPTQGLTVKGDFMVKPTEQPVEDGGSLVVAYTYSVALPVGTDIQEGDEVDVGSDVYTVIGVNTDETYKVRLHVSLRLVAGGVE